MMNLDHERAADQLSEFDKRILWRVVENGKCRSAVTIAAEEWLGETDVFLTVDTVIWSLKFLNDLGYVRYFLAGQSGQGLRGDPEASAHDQGYLPQEIKPTHLGYAYFGYVRSYHVFESSLTKEMGKSTTPLHPGDATDFRSQPFHTFGGEIEKETIEEHLVRFPDHIYIHSIDEEDLLMSRDPLVSAVVEQIRDEELHGKKQAILSALHQNGMAQDVSTLSSWLTRMGAPMNPREIVKTLWSMQKTQLVSFKERYGGLFKIRMTDVAGSQFEKPKRERAPVEQIVAPKKPVIVPSVPYRVPEPPRYASPPPPAQNIKSFTDESSLSHAAGSTSEVTGNTSEVHGKDVQMDTHTQYRPDGQINVYPESKGRGGNMTMRRVLPLLRHLVDNGPATTTQIHKAIGTASNAGPITVMLKACTAWGWVEADAPERSRNRMFHITDAGRQALKESGGWIPAPLPVVARDEADAEKKEDVEWMNAPMGPIDEARAEFKREEVKAAGRLMAPAPSLDDFPLIQDLMGKQGRIARYEQAAKLLENDDEELVLQLLSKIELTELEKEVIRYVQAVQS